MFEDIIKKDITREQKVLVYVLKTLNDLVEKGIMEGGGYQVTEEGLKYIKGFEPTDDELRECIDLLKADGVLGEPLTSLGMAMRTLGI
jgi:hypothetical protein